MTETFEEKVAGQIDYSELNSGLRFIADMTDMDTVKKLIIKLNGSGESFSFPKMETYTKAVKRAIVEEFPDEASVIVARKTGMNVRRVNRILNKSN